MLQLKNKNRLSLPQLFPKPLEFEPVKIDERDELMRGVVGSQYETWVLEDGPQDPEALQSYLQNMIADTAISDTLD